MKKKIKLLVEFCLFCIGKLLSVFYPYSMANSLKYYKSRIYTHRLSSKFKSFGKHSNLNYPIDLHGSKYISIGEKTGIGKRGFVTAWDTYMHNSYNPEIIIGDNTWIGDDCHITAINKIEIGNNVLMGKKITISDNAHGKAEFKLLSTAPKYRPLFSKGPVIIEDGVWIGDKASILAGVRIGKNAIIGANAVVTQSIPANCVAVGVPAIVIKNIT
jgi:acetyltransferase-like isoleucine patch superfamily enzyme